MLNKIGFGFVAIVVALAIIPTVQAAPVNQAVDITATVNQILTFNLGGVANVYFGTLGAGATKYASATSTSGHDAMFPAHFINLNTNSTGGYTLTVSGNTLTSVGGDTITPLTASSTAIAGTEQFGLNVGWTEGSGVATIDYGTWENYMFHSGDTIVDNAGVTASDKYVVTYVANIAPLTEAGTYTTTLTYTATGHF